MRRYNVYLVPRFHTTPLGNEDLHYRWASPEDIDAIAGRDVKRDYLDRRLEAGARIALAEDDGVLVGWKFFQTGHCDQYDWIALRMPDDMACIFAAYTDPAYRGRRIQSKLVAFGAEAWPDENLRRFVWIIDRKNTASLKMSDAITDVVPPEIRSLEVHSLAGVKLVRYNGRWRAGRWNRDRRCEITID